VFNISDIFDKHKKEEPPERPEKKGEEAGTPTPVVIKSAEEGEGLGLKLYAKTFDLAKEIYLSAREGRVRWEEEIRLLVQELSVLLSQEDPGLPKKCFSDYERAEEYLYYHVVNVSILSMMIARGLGYERQDLVELGLCALLHDIGLMHYLGIIHQAKVLTKEEFAQVREHPRVGFEMLSRVDPKLSAGLLEGVRQEHERIDGSGYPAGRTEGEICRNAQIMGLVDTFEALTHSRPHRAKHSSLEASKVIIDAKSAFSSKIIKVLFERVGIFPSGTTVRLNTKELGVVLRVNAEFPLRPVVKVLFDVDGQELQEPKVVDLAKSRVLFIVESL
jgi:HD-GYP domain-containing protein (c-di-GMP phosphodiesterase class II)